MTIQCNPPEPEEADCPAICTPNGAISQVIATEWFQNGESCMENVSCTDFPVGPPR
jgi:hypothetical protein